MRWTWNCRKKRARQTRGAARPGIDAYYYFDNASAEKSVGPATLQWAPKPARTAREPLISAAPLAMNW
jgi:hypothetical protein